MIYGTAKPQEAGGSAHQGPIVCLKKLAKRYGEHVALVSVDLSIDRGEFITLLGPSGSGKTTMLHLIAGLIEPTSGEIWIDGVNVTNVPSRYRGLGMVFQNYALMPHMTIFENVAFPLRIRGIPRKEIEPRVTAALEMVQLTALRNRKPNQVSGGQQQRAAIARCIVYSPAITLMDEPLGALDKKLREQMQLELKKLHAQLGTTLLYVTHDQGEAMTMSDRIVLMNVGRIEQIGTPSELYFNPASVFAAEFLGDSNLLPGTVVGLGRPIGVRLIGGQVAAASRGNATQKGQPVKLMVRPENVQRLEHGAASEGLNRLSGRLVDTIILGAILKHYVQLADKSMFVVQESYRGGRQLPKKGDVIELGWHSDDTIIYPEQSPGASA
jgi:putative spermidine/putrescine transport system ATP-binding protein